MDFKSRLVLWGYVDILHGYLEPLGEGQAFDVAPDALAQLASLEVGMRVGAGVVAKLKTQRLKKKLVRIVAITLAWATRAVAANLQHEAIFAKDCYYVNARFAVYVAWTRRMKKPKPTTSVLPPAVEGVKPTAA